MLWLAIAASQMTACGSDDAATSVTPLDLDATSTAPSGATSEHSTETAATSATNTTSHPSATTSAGLSPSTSDDVSARTNESTAPAGDDVDSTSPLTTNTTATNTTTSGAVASTLDTSATTSDADHGTASDTSTDVKASNVCNEDVPDERYVDGIPAYTQCADSESVAIWSNDGVSTTVTEQDEWRRTQWDGGYQCTEFANRYLFFVWGVERVPNGDAGTWCDAAPPEGLVQSSAPVHGDLIVFAPGSCGASPETGHVAVVDTVDETSARVVIVEQNRAGRRTTDVECAACFLHAINNDEL